MLNITIITSSLFFSSEKLLGMLLNFSIFSEAELSFLAILVKKNLNYLFILRISIDFLGVRVEEIVGTSTG